MVQTWLTQPHIFHTQPSWWEPGPGKDRQSFEQSTSERATTPYGKVAYHNTEAEISSHGLPEVGPEISLIISLSIQAHAPRPTQRLHRSKHHRFGQLFRFTSGPCAFDLMTYRRNSHTCPIEGIPHAASFILSSLATSCWVILLMHTNRLPPSSRGWGHKR